MEPELRVIRGGWVAVGEGLAVTATSGQEALLRFNIELQRRAEAREPVRAELLLEERPLA